MILGLQIGKGDRLIIENEYVHKREGKKMPVYHK